ncbi:SRPBCC family protein [Dietzia cercidiphylli]|uniref:SRPBCC family protein n=2 Tax=Dietziaceae TaxID=85029 RepID=A0ABP4V0M0_9ACTN
MSTTDGADDPGAEHGPATVMTASRTIPASPSEIFALLADPTRHKDTEPGDWVRDAVTTEAISGVGDVFAITMYREAGGGDYVIHNVVTAFDPDRTIEWEPGQPDATGQISTGGWRWRYDLAPAGASTEVTLRYDWSATSREQADEIGGMPPFGRDFLEASLASLEAALAT